MFPETYKSSPFFFDENEKESILEDTIDVYRSMIVKDYNLIKSDSIEFEELISEEEYMKMYVLVKS